MRQDKAIAGFGIDIGNCEIREISDGFRTCLAEEACEFALQTENGRLCQNPAAKQILAAKLQHMKDRIKKLRKEVNSPLFSSKAAEIASVISKIDALFDDGLPLKEMQALRDDLIKTIKAKPHREV